MRIAVLCNDRLGLPALQQLVQNRMIQAVATSDRSPEMVGIMQLITQQGGVPSNIFTRKNFEAELLAWLEQFKPDVVLVKTFPFRIPASALRIPKHGFINFHYAPLPAYRGSNPLFWMIREGITTGGVAIHRMDEQFDTGPILLQAPVPFPPDASFGVCVTHLAHAGAQLTFMLLQGLQNNTLQETPQVQTTECWYGRPGAADLFIQWATMPAAAVKNQVNACNPWLKGAPTRWKGMGFSIADASLSDMPVPAGTLPGTIFHLSEAGGVVIACCDGNAIRADVVSLDEGFFGVARLRSFGLKTGDRLG